jgi:hypothetical protein
LIEENFDLFEQARVNNYKLKLFYKKRARIHHRKKSQLYMNAMDVFFIHKVENVHPCSVPIGLIFYRERAS